VIELRPYQEECVKRVLDAYEKEPNGKEFVVLSTGAGKTIIFSYVAHELKKRHGVNVLVLAHRDELISQAADKYKLIDPTAIIGKVGSGVHEYGAEITVASIATVSRSDHINKLKMIGYGLIIIDECHHSSSASYTRVMNALPDAFVLGVTATPDRLDKKAIFDGKKPLFQANIVDLVQSGYLCNFRAVAIQTDTNIDNVGRSMGDFNEKELDNAVNIPKRNQLIVQKYVEYANGKRAACFCVSVSHAEAMAEAFETADISSAVIKGSTPIEERARIYKAFEHGEIKVLCSVMVLTEGWDSPRCEVIIMARPTQSRSLYVQMFGRGLRLAPGKKECIVLDITDNSTKHRLTTQKLKSAIEKECMRNGESLLDTLAREHAESEERQIQVRKLKEKRFHDIQIDLFNTLEWKELPNGVFLLEIGHEGHKIALTPSKSNPDLYYVQFKRAPHNRPNDKAQLLTDNPIPVDWAQSEAERIARKILSDPRGINLVDRNAPWRDNPISEKQKGMLKMYRIPLAEGMTSGQASDLIEAHKAEIERRKAAKAAKKPQKEALNA
jgi:superfamily II DNA or RNA helicase